MVVVVGTTQVEIKVVAYVMDRKSSTRQPWLDEISLDGVRIKTVHDKHTEIVISVTILVSNGSPGVEGVSILTSPSNLRS